VHQTLRVRLRITETSPVKESGNAKPVETAGAQESKAEQARKAEEQKRNDPNRAEEKKNEEHKIVPSPPLPPSVDCHAPGYGGLDFYTLKWKGVLAPGDVLNITGRTASTGLVMTGQLPGCPVSLTVLSGDAIDIQQPSDNYRQIRITNKSAGTITTIQIGWKIK
jgi:hypothetical protein